MLNHPGDDGTMQIKKPHPNRVDCSEPQILNKAK